MSEHTFIYTDPEDEDDAEVNYDVTYEFIAGERGSMTDPPYADQVQLVSVVHQETGEQIDLKNKHNNKYWLEDVEAAAMEHHEVNHSRASHESLEIDRWISNQP